mmetsp:Transcript_652/g.1284  ORF Transcript_652/g.1284 Transcript_652/m.1284 type:complete len:115 (+) Transcript_652:110-454(+)
MAAHDNTHQGCCGTSDCVEAPMAHSLGDTESGRLVGRRPSFRTKQCEAAAKGDEHPMEDARLRERRPRFGAKQLRIEVQVPPAAAGACKCSSAVSFFMADEIGGPVRIPGGGWA